MIIDTTTTDTPRLHQDRYLDVVRLGDGRYCVRFMKDGAVPRTSYTTHLGDVVKQAQRAGNIPIHTRDADVQRLCQDQQVELI